MRKANSALGFFFGSILYAVIWIRIFYFSYNYRKTDDLSYGFILLPSMFIVFWFFGIYINGTIFRFFSKRERDMAPSRLLYGSVLIFVLSLCLLAVLGIDRFGIDFWILGIILLFQIVGLITASRFQINKSVRHFVGKISSTLLINLILLMVVCINDFPGVNAPIESRQKWAYKEFTSYSFLVDSIKGTNEITDKVGQVKFVAPTKGRNLLFRIGAGNMPISDLTLEVVGEKGTGIAYINALGSSIWGICFEYQGKTTKLWGSQSCN